MPKAFFMRQSLLVTFALGLAGCTVHPSETPDLTGPSSFARSLSVTATPDNVTADGSQSAIVATLRDANGAPIAGAPLQVSIAVGNAVVEFGSLSARTIYTDANGRAAAVYVAPVASPFFAGGPPTVVAIHVTPIGNNFDTAVSERATIQVTPPPVPVPQTGAPTAAVTYSPSAPKAGQVVAFDATGSQPGPGRTIASYFWDFGDGRVNDEHGDDASHAYAAAGTYVVVLGVVDDLGRISSTFKTIVVTP